MNDKVLDWVKAALIRAVKTAAQSLVACVGTSAVNIVSLDWPQMLGIAATAFVLSICNSLAGVPEVSNGDSITKIAKS